MDKDFFSELEPALLIQKLGRITINILRKMERNDGSCIMRRRC